MSHSQSNEELISVVKRLDISKNEMVLVGGAALEMFGIRTASVIDLVVSPEAMINVLEKADTKRGAWAYSLGHIGTMAQVKLIGRGRGEGIYKEDITFMPAPNDHLYQATFEQLRDEATDVSGVLVSPPSRILDWKQHVAKEDDLKDAMLIEDYLQNHSQTFNLLDQLVNL